MASVTRKTPDELIAAFKLRGITATDRQSIRDLVGNNYDRGNELLAIAFRRNQR